jgi:hypothetical protein
MENSSNSRESRKLRLIVFSHLMKCFGSNWEKKEEKNPGKRQIIALQKSNRGEIQSL